VINDYAWIGARAIIQPGVIIGRGAVLGSGSIATKNIPEFEIYAGTPAKYIGTRSRDLTYKLNYSPFFQ
jgi:maltose O-acetyltransferase